MNAVSIQASLLRSMLFMLFAVVPGADADGIYKCTGADGSITISDLACPADSVAREYREYREYRRKSAPSFDTYGSADDP